MQNVTADKDGNFARAPRAAVTEPAAECVNVLCVITRGLNGPGGIDRLFSYLAMKQSYVNADRIKVRFFTSRGNTAGSTWLILFPLRVLLYLYHLLFLPVDIVHLNLSINASAYRKYILLMLARALGKKVIVHFHGGGFEHMLRDRSLSVRVILSIFRKADHLIVLGEFWRQLLGDAAGLAPDTIHVIYNAVPDFGSASNLVRPNTTRLRLLFAGELHYRKGVDVLLEALAALNRRYQDWTCIIAGNGPKTHYQSTAEQLGIAQQASFVGWLSSEHLHRLMLESDVVVLPSRGEGLPLCLVEAAAAGAALVATDEGATREVLHDGVNGLIVPLDPNAICDALCQLAENSNLLASMQTASRAHYVRQFGLDRMIADLHSVYLRAAANAVIRA